MSAQPLVDGMENGDCFSCLARSLVADISTFLLFFASEHHPLIVKIETWGCSSYLVLLFILGASSGR